MYTVVVLALVLGSLPLLGFCQNVTITTTDSRMHFEGTWFQQDSGGHETTATLGSSVSLVFPGTAIYWHATKNPNCGIGNVSIDNDSGVQVDASLGTSQNDSAVRAILFSRTGLQSGISHSINITFYAIGSLGGPYMEVYNFTYTQDDTVTSTALTNTIIPSNTPSTAASTTESHKISNTGAIAGGIVGGLLGAGLILFGCIFLVHRNRRKGVDGPITTPYIIERTGAAFLGSKSASINPISPSPFPPRSLPSSQPPASYSQSQPEQSTPELTPTPMAIPTTHTETIHSPSLIPLPQLVLAPNRNEPAPSIADVPPPPYIPRSNE